MRGTPGSAYPQPEPNATELPSIAPCRPDSVELQASAPSPTPTRAEEHIATTLDCRPRALARRRAPKRTSHYTCWCERGTNSCTWNSRSARNLGARNRDAAVAASSFIVTRIVVATAPLTIVCAATKRHHNVSAALRTSPRPRRALRGIVQCLRRSAPCAFPFAKPRHNVRKRSAPNPT